MHVFLCSRPFFSYCIITIHVCRYRIYAEGSAWSVSIKYGLACGSTMLLIEPVFKAFYDHGLKDGENCLVVPKHPALCENMRDKVGSISHSSITLIGATCWSPVLALHLSSIATQIKKTVLFDKNYSGQRSFGPRMPASVQKNIAAPLPLGRN